MKTIEARISPRGLKHVASYFDNSLRSVLRELLQNCRRAHATRIDVTCDEEPNGHLRISVSDNGMGIDDAQDLITLFETGWDAQTKKSETPAGMGFFALAHLESGVRVLSRDWSTHITAKVFTGEDKANVHTLNTSIPGTRLEFYLDEDSDDFIEALKAESEFFPAQVRLNMIGVDRRDFLSDAEFIHDEPGQYRIGIFKDVGLAARRTRCINFYGVVIDSPEYIYRPRGGYYALIDVTDSKSLDLELPARKNLVQNDKWKAMLVAVRKAAYLSIKASGGGHHLRFTDWKEATKLGVELPEALPHLAYAHPEHLHQEMEWDEFGSDPGICETVTPDMLISELDNEDLTALYINECDCGNLLTAHQAMNGYSWYPTRVAKRLTQEIILENRKGFFSINSGETRWFDALGLSKFVADGYGFTPTSDVVPTAINLCMDIRTPGGKGKITEKYPANIAFTCDLTGTIGVRSGWVAVDASKVTPETLAGLFFQPDEYSDGERISEDCDELESKARIEIARRTHGVAASARMILQQAVDGAPFARALELLGVSSVTLELVEGQIQIRL